jgi:AcrR family transcriptional regulator
MTDPSPGVVRRSPGRPSRISSEQIVSAALRLLEEDGLAEFTMAKLAKQVGVSVMALYTYFPSRSALLDAAADSIFSHFEPAEPAKDWEQAIRNWIYALHRGFDRRPIALKLIRWDEHVSPAWLRAWLPMVRVLVAEGLAGERLVFACSWLSNAVMGSIQAHSGAGRTATLAAMVGRAGLSDADDALLAEVARNHDPEKRQAIFAFETENIIRGLALLIRDQRP